MRWRASKEGFNGGLNIGLFPKDKPCCPEAAASMAKRLTFPDGIQVGISNLEDILKDVADLRLADDEAIEKELLSRVKIHNYVPPPAEPDYCQALFGEYKKAIWETGMKLSLVELKSRV